MPNDDKFGFGRILDSFAKAKNEIPILIANKTQNYFAQSWQTQSWDGQKWPEVKRRQEGTNEYKYPKNKGLGRRTRAILVQSGALRRAVQNSIRQATFNKVHLVIPLDYAGIHNFGGEGLAFGKHRFMMPKRQYMGQTDALTVIQKEVITSNISKIWPE